MGLDMFLYNKQQQEVGYWRKANAIHNWFVQHVQAGQDDGNSYPVTHDHLQGLLDIVNKVLEATKLVSGTVHVGDRGTKDGWEPILKQGLTVEDSTVAQNLLPTQSGFFFGSTDYDEFYVQNLQHTKEVLEKALQDKSESYTYWASW